MPSNQGSGLNRSDSGKACKILRVLLLGKDGVGKSALSVRFMTKRFIGEYDRSTETMYSKPIKYEGQDILLEIKDTAQDNYDEKRQADILWADLVILMYSVVDRKSFLEVYDLYKFVESMKQHRGVDYVLVGNKTDLNEAREVLTLEGRTFSTYAKCRFYEISVYEGYQEVNDLLLAILDYGFVNKSRRLSIGQRKRGISMKQMVIKRFGNSGNGNVSLAS